MQLHVRTYKYSIDLSYIVVLVIKRRFFSPRFVLKYTCYLSTIFRTIFRHRLWQQATVHPTSGRCSNGGVISDRPHSNADPMFEEYGHAQTMRTGGARCYKHDTNTYDVSMGYGFMLLKKGDADY